MMTPAKIKVYRAMLLAIIATQLVFPFGVRGAGLDIGSDSSINSFLTLSTDKQLAESVAALTSATAAAEASGGVGDAAPAEFLVKDIGVTAELQGVHKLLEAQLAQKVSESEKDVADTWGAIGKEILKNLKNTLLAILKRQILNAMVNQVVNWIQGGGEPKFITDWQSFFGDIAQGAVGDFVEQIGAGFLCEPFSLQVRVGLLPVKHFDVDSPNRCTLDKIVQNVENFTNDFRNGGWIAYNAASEPNNNYYGSLLIAWDARNSYVADKLAAEANRAFANKGFLGTRRCYDAKTGKDVPDGTPSSRCEDTTPGGVVSAALEKAVGSDFDFIINAQDLGSYAEAIVNALVNRIIIEGVNGLRGVHQSSGSSYQPSRPSGPTYGGFRSTTEIPGDTRAALSRYNSAATDSTGGNGTSVTNLSGLSRTQLVSRLDAALTKYTAARTQFETASDLTSSYLAVTQDTLACHDTVPALRSGTIHDAILQKNSTAQRYADLTQSPAQDNLNTIDELMQAIDLANSLTDAQFSARANEFQTAFIDSDTSIVNARASQATSLLQQMRTVITTAVVADAQRDLDYCISQGGTVGNRTNGVAAVEQIFRGIISGREEQFVGRTFVSTDGTTRVIKRIIRNSSDLLGSTILFNTKAPGETVSHEEQMSLRQLQTLAQAGGLRML